ncbi:MAG TPA: oxygenase MpaB family protein [Acidimicrobiales bacterium]|nr:oxygenase MpaB family protein [Acidimicrobiales bacterium]
MLSDDSLLVRIAGDWRSLLPGPSAGVLQLLHPTIGDAVYTQSDFMEDPFGRVYRSIPQIWATLLAPDREERGRRIRDTHKQIRGALNPDAFWWAHATFTWEMFRATELFFARRLDADDERQLYAETVEWYRQYGVSMRPVPATYADFRARFAEVIATDLELTPAATHTIDIGTTGGFELPGGPPGMERLVAPVARAVLFGAMPRDVRRRFDLPFTTADRWQLRAVSTALKAGGAVVPTSVNRAFLTWRLRALGAATRDQRYVPAAT